MDARRLALLLAGCILLIPGWAAAGQTPPASTAFQTRHARLTLDGAGRVAGLLDKQTGRDVRAAGAPEPFVTVRKGGAWLPPSGMTRSGSLLTFSFADPSLSVVLKVTPRPAYLAVGLQKVAGAGVEEVAFCSVKVALAPRISDMSGMVSDGKVSCALRVLNPQTGYRYGGGPTPFLTATWAPGTGTSGSDLAGVGAALFVCPAPALREAMKAAMKQEGLLSSKMGGPFALDAPEVRGSYVFAFGLSEKNVDQWIALAKKAGIAELHLCGWEQSLGTYQPNKEYFPHGVDGLKAVIKKIHAAGLIAGMHTLTALMGPNDPFVTPVPDPDLAVDASYTLTAPMGIGDTEFGTAEAPANLDTIWAYGSRGNVLRVDDELIQYAAYSGTAPFGFSKCTRGAFGTKPAAHAKGAAVKHIGVYAGCLLPDEKSPLIDKIAERIAAVCNTCGFDMIYMDGAEGTPGGWWGVHRMRAAIYKRLTGRVMVEASEWGYHSWPFHSRIGAWDYPNWGLKPFTDTHCRSNEEVRATAFMPAELGWWCIFGANEDRYAQMPDETEYLFCKALAFDMPMSFQGIGLGEPENARQPEYLEMMGRYERLRLANRVPEAIKAKLREPGREFHLVGSSFIPTDYLTHRVTGTDDASDAWTVKNRFAAQPARLRIQALYAAAGPGSPDAVALPIGGKGTSAPEGSPGTTGALAPSDEKTPTGEACLALSAKGPGGRGAWARAMTAYEPQLNLSKCGALGVWIKGDGKGEILNLQLTNPIQYWPTFDEHYVKVDFTGWRYVELHLRERDAAAWGDYAWPYGDIYSVNRNPLIRGAVNGLNLYLNNLPANGSVQCLVGPVRALPTLKSKLANPAVTLNGRTLTFPVTLESGQYLEFDSMTDCRHYDERGKLLGRLQPQGDAPTVQSGDNALRFTCVRPSAFRPRANVTVIVAGEAAR